jgi:hypothetical protein
MYIFPHKGLITLYFTVTSIPIVRQWLGKHILATHAHATIGHPLLGNGPVKAHPSRKATFFFRTMPMGYIEIK